MSKKPVILLPLLALTLSALLTVSPSANAQAIQLQITGQVKSTLTLTLDDLKAMPQTTENATLYCVDAPATPLQDGNWTGVQLGYLLQQAHVSDDAVKVEFVASDNYTTDLTVHTATQDNTILVAYEHNGASLDGLRLVVPSCWGYKWINDLTQITLVHYDFFGTWESRGYPDSGKIGEFPASNPSSTFTNSDQPPWTQSRDRTKTATPEPSTTATPTPTPDPTPFLPPTNQTMPPAVSTSQTDVQAPMLFYGTVIFVIIAISILVPLIALNNRRTNQAEKD